MTLITWAKKELARMKLQSPKRLLPARTNIKRSAKPLVPSQISQVVLAADLRCKRCQERLATTLSTIKNDWESIEVHAVEKKVTLNTKSNVHCN